MEIDDHNQELSAELLHELEADLRKAELHRRMVDASIDIKQASGYFEAVSRNAHVDHWRRTFPDEYNEQRRKDREAEAEQAGRTLRPYQPSTPDRRAGQLRTSKAKTRLDPDYARDEQEKNTKARSAARALLTEHERVEVNRVRREKRAAKKTTPSAD